MSANKLSRRNTAHLLTTLEPLYKRYVDEDASFVHYVSYRNIHGDLFNTLYTVTQELGEGRYAAREDEITAGHYLGRDVELFDNMGKKEHLGVRNGLYLVLEQVYEDAEEIAAAYDADEAADDIREEIERSPVYEHELVEFRPRQPNMEDHEKIAGIVDDIVSTADTINGVQDILDGTTPAAQRLG